MLFSYAQSCFFALEYSGVEHLSESEWKMDGLVLGIFGACVDFTEWLLLTMFVTHDVFLCSNIVCRDEPQVRDLSESKLKIDSLLFIILGAT
jgi:hypothetical protein